MFKAIKNYNNKALEPYLSDETQIYHFEKHHTGYANTLTNLTNGTDLQNLSINEIISKKKDISPKIFNNAAQIFNHDFYWNSLSIKKTEPSFKLLSEINKHFISLDKFYETYINTASEIFGSGWSWLALDKSSNDIKLFIMNTSNADTPIVYDNLYPLLTIDLWEHSYYIDYRNDRKSYIETLIRNCLNWDFANEQFEKNIV